jgi:protein ImuA
MRDSARLAHLRAALVNSGLEPPEKHARVSLGCASLDLALKGGLARGALHEIFAHPGDETTTTGFAVALVQRLNTDKHLLWIRQDFSALEHGELSATGLLELGLDPERVLVLRVPDAVSALRAAGDALTCAALGAVLIETSGEAKILNLVTSRRLTLASAQDGVTTFLLRFGAKPQASAAETRWHVRSQRSLMTNEHWGNPVFKTELVRNRHGTTGHWVVEWNCDDGLFRELGGEETADRGAVVPTSSDRPAAAALDAGKRATSAHGLRAIA